MLVPAQSSFSSRARRHPSSEDFPFQIFIGRAAPDVYELRIHRPPGGSAWEAGSERRRELRWLKSGKHGMGSAGLMTSVRTPDARATWPAELRPKMAKGTRASLHAKCAVADGKRLLVSSANLTEFALTLNIELGLLVEGDDAPRRVQQHLESLFQTETLRPVVAGYRVRENAERE